MTNVQKSGLKDAFNNTAALASAGALAGAFALGAGPLGAVAGAVMAVGSAVGVVFSRKKLAEPQAFIAADIEISVETGAPVKAMKQIKLRR